MKKQKVIITGGSGDIAQAISKELAQNPIYTILTPSKQELDVTNKNQVFEYFENNIPDILINNAGAILLESIKDNFYDEHQKVIDIDLSGTFLCTNAVLLKNPNAKIVNIGSAAGTKVHANWSSYCAAKAAVIMATKCWAEEGVDTICISPGRTLTNMRKKMYPNEDESTLMTPKDFARVVKNIIESDYIKGSNFDININNFNDFLK